MPQKEGVTTVCHAYEDLYGGKAPMPSKYLRKNTRSYINITENSFQFCSSNHLQTYGTGQGSPRRPKGIAVCFKFPVPHPLSARKINKKAIKLPSYRYLPTPNVSFSPSFLRFRPDFTFHPTFSGDFFLLPILFLFTVYGHCEGCTDNRILQDVPYRMRQTGTR